MAGPCQTRHRYSGGSKAGKPRILIVTAPYYRHIAEKLLQGARSAIDAEGWSWTEIEVPGALEIPAAIGIASEWERFDGYVALGCVIRGETTHYETVCTESARGIMQLNLQGACIGNGILTVENEEQALERADPVRGDKGGEAAEAAVSLVSLRLGLTEPGIPAGPHGPDAG